MFNKKVILFVLVLLILPILVLAQREVECSTNADCGNGYICDKVAWTCIQTGGGSSSTLEDYQSNPDQTFIIGILIGVVFILVLIIIGFIIGRKRKH